MADEVAAYEAEVKRMRDTYGQNAEIPRHPYGQITDDPDAMTLSAQRRVPTQSITHRIADLSKQLVEAGHELESARGACLEADARKAQWETTFAQVSDQVMKAIHEHQEGTPKNDPYLR